MRGLRVRWRQCLHTTPSSLSLSSPRFPPLFIPSWLPCSLVSSRSCVVSPGRLERPGGRSWGSLQLFVGVWLSRYSINIGFMHTDFFFAAVHPFVWLFTGSYRELIQMHTCHKSALTSQWSKVFFVWAVLRREHWLNYYIIHLWTPGLFNW